MRKPVKTAKVKTQFTNYDQAAAIMFNFQNPAVQSVRITMADGTGVEVKRTRPASEVLEFTK